MLEIAYFEYLSRDIGRNIQAFRTPWIEVSNMGLWPGNNKLDRLLSMLARNSSQPPVGFLAGYQTNPGRHTFVGAEHDHCPNGVLVGINIPSTAIWAHDNDPVHQLAPEILPTESQTLLTAKFFP
jgi:hypothetical protein